MISAIISRSCGERTEEDSWAVLGKSASEGPKCDDDEVVEGSATTEESTCNFFLIQRVESAGFKNVCVRKNQPADPAGGK